MDSKQLNNENLNNVSGGNLTDSNKTFSANNDSDSNLYTSDSSIYKSVGANASDIANTYKSDLSNSSDDASIANGKVVDSTITSDNTLGYSNA